MSLCEHTFVWRSSRIGETENQLRRALDRGDPYEALRAARQLRKFQAAGDRALGTAIQLTLLLSRQQHALGERARRRWIERAKAELAGQLAVIAAAALDGLPEPSIERTCAGILTVAAQAYEWTPIRAG